MNLFTFGWIWKPDIVCLSLILKLNGILNFESNQMFQKVNQGSLTKGLKELRILLLV